MSGLEVGAFIVAGTLAFVGTATVAAGTIYGLMKLEARIQRRNRQRATR